MSETAPFFVYVDSRKRQGYPAGSDSDFTFAIPFPPNADYDSVTVIDLLCPKSYYLVQPNGYNMFQLQEGNSIVSITVPIGCYLLNAFANKIGSLLTAGSPNGWTYAVTYPSSSGADTGKYTYTVSNNTSQ